MKSDLQLDALGDGTRRAILDILREGGLSVGDIAQRLPVSRPAVSQHLRVLREAGLVQSEIDGTRHLYSIDRTGLEALRRFVEDMWQGALSRFAEEAQKGARR